jgi:hypothetical protein
LYIGFVVIPFIGGVAGLVECYFEFKKSRIVQGCFTLAFSILLLVFQVVFFWAFLFNELVSLTKQLSL